MPSTFGIILRRFREERQFTLRELGRLAEIDFAYIHRLETGEKEAPSEDILKRLIRVLKLDARKSQILRFLVGKEIEINLIDLVLNNSSIEIDDFESAAQMKFRGRPADWHTILDRVRKLRQEIHDG